MRGEPGRGLGPAAPQAVDASAEVGVEPALEGAGAEGQVGGDLLVRSAAVGHEDDREAGSA